MRVSTEHKAHWVEEFGIKTEARFLQTLWKHGIDAIINPAKREDPTAHDLSLIAWPGDLKTVETPLFKAQALYDSDPQYTVTLNVRDVEEYDVYNPHIMLFFHLLWEKETEKVIGSTRYSVKPMQGVWMVWLPMFHVFSEQMPVINYQRREDDQNGNAKNSYVFDVRLFPRLFRKWFEPVNGKVVLPAGLEPATSR
jgi:hypothetical protein